MLQSRFFFTPAFEIYGGALELALLSWILPSSRSSTGSTGFFDYGPPGASLQANIIELWRKHFVVEEEMLELDTTIITIADVLKTSGHVDKFTDWMVKDVKTGEIFRADHLVEAVLEARLKGDREARGVAEATLTEAEAEAAAKSKKKKIKSKAVKLDDAVVAEYDNVLAQIDNYTGKDLGELMRKHEIKAPETGNDLTEPVEFNLMFDVSIGPTGAVKGCFAIATSCDCPPDTRPATCDQRQLKVISSTSPAFSSRTMVASPSPALRSASLSATRSARARVFCESGALPFPLSARDLPR